MQGSVAEFIEQCAAPPSASAGTTACASGDSSNASASRSPSGSSSRSHWLPEKAAARYPSLMELCVGQTFLSAIERLLDARGPSASTAPSTESAESAEGQQNLIALKRLVSCAIAALKTNGSAGVHVRLRIHSANTNTPLTEFTLFSELLIKLGLHSIKCILLFRFRFILKFTNIYLSNRIYLYAFLYCRFSSGASADCCGSREPSSSSRRARPVASLFAVHLLRARTLVFLSDSHIFSIISEFMSASVGDRSASASYRRISLTFNDCYSAYIVCLRFSAWLLLRILSG